jgi:hypothetical protein
LQMLIVQLLAGAYDQLASKRLKRHWRLRMQGLRDGFAHCSLR